MNRRLPVSKPLVIMVFATLILVPATVSGESSVWVATSGGNTVYLGGTFHLLRPSDYPVPEEFETAYEQADVVYFETDVAAMSDPAFAAQMMQHLTYPEGLSLTDVIEDDTYAELVDYLAGFGVPKGSFEMLKPGILVSTLETLEFLRLGFQPSGVDVHFTQRAISDDKPRLSLETTDEQVQLLATMGEGYEDDLISEYLDDVQEFDTSIDELVTAWRTGDTKAMNRLFVDDLKGTLRPMYDSLIVERNENWLPVILSMFNDAPTELVLVGAGHLTGPDGLVTMLRGLGYSVEKL